MMKKTLTSVVFLTVILTGCSGSSSTDFGDPEQLFTSARYDVGAREGQIVFDFNAAPTVSQEFFRSLPQPESETTLDLLYRSFSDNDVVFDYRLKPQSNNFEWGSSDYSVFLQDDEKNIFGFLQADKKSFVNVDIRHFNSVSQIFSEEDLEIFVEDGPLSDVSLIKNEWVGFDGDFWGQFSELVFQNVVKKFDTKVFGDVLKKNIENNGVFSSVDDNTVRITVDSEKFVNGVKTDMSKFAPGVEKSPVVVALLDKISEEESFVVEADVEDSKLLALRVPVLSVEIKFFEEARSIVAFDNVEKIDELSGITKFFVPKEFIPFTFELAEDGGH